MSNKTRDTRVSMDVEVTLTQRGIGIRPRSLTMGPALILANACGEEEAQLITAAWKPKWNCILVETLPEGGWQ